MKLFFLPFLITVFFLSSCQNKEEFNYAQYTYKEIDKFKKYAFKKYGVVLWGKGGGFMDQINEISLTFYIQKELKVKEMRELIINLSCDFLKQINSNNEIRQYLAEHPFTSKRLDLAVAIFNSKKTYITNPGSTKEKLALGVLNKDNICYTIKNEEEQFLQKVYKETFQEAIEKVQISQIQLNK